MQAIALNMTMNGTLLGDIDKVRQAKRLTNSSDISSLKMNVFNLIHQFLFFVCLFVLIGPISVVTFVFCEGGCHDNR